MRSIEDKGCYNKHGQIQEISSSSSINFEFHKVNGTTTRPSHHNHNHTHTHTHRTALGKPTPSKWDDAHKWLAGLSRGGVDKKQSISITQPRNSNADDRRLIAPAPQHEEDPDTDFSSQLVNASYKVETKKIDCDESVWRINKHNHEHANAIAIANDATTIPIRSICLRDMGTEMTPIASQEPSRTGTPIRATTPVGRSPITSGPSTPDRSCQNPSANAPAVDDLPRHCGQVSNGGEMPKINNPLETRALAWDEAERDKYMARYKHEEVKIQAWETHQKRKAEMEMKKMEAKAERMKARAQEKLTNKLAATKRIAEEKRANAEAKLNEDAMKTQESADYIRRTGHMPCSFSFKMPSLCW
ncbi:hypothetical protein ACFE04_024197 [Oxalis oulophora]